MFPYPSVICKGNRTQSEHVFTCQVQSLNNRCYHKTCPHSIQLVSTKKNGNFHMRDYVTLIRIRLAFQIATIRAHVYKTLINPLNPVLNPTCYLLALLGAHHFLHVSRIRVKSLTFRLLMSYIYMEHPFLMFLDHTQRRSTVGRTPLDE